MLALQINIPITILINVALDGTQCFHRVVFKNKRRYKGTHMQGNESKCDEEQAFHGASY